MTCFGGEWFDLWNVFAFAFAFALVFVFLGPICLGPEPFGGEWCDLWNVDIYLNLHLSERGNLRADANTFVTEINPMCICICHTVQRTFAFVTECNMHLQMWIDYEQSVV